MAACLGMTTGKPTLIDIGGRILTIRGRRVLLDSDLAAVYGVKTLRLNEQVRRNSSRFPDDFLLRLTTQEFAALRSQFAILKLDALEKTVVVLDANSRRQFKELRTLVFSLAMPPAKDQ
jgi:hypothetical protein